MNGILKRVLLTVLSATVLMTFVVGCGKGSVAKVNGRKITRQEYNNRLERLAYRDPNTGQQTEAGALVLQRLISEELVVRLAEKEKVAPTEQQIKERLAEVSKQPGFNEEMKAAGITKNQLRERMKVEQAAFNLQTKGVTVTDKEVKEFYDQYKDTLYTTPEQVRVAAIFLKDEADTKKAVEFLEKKVDFGTVARTLSVDQASAQQDGVLPRSIIRGDENVPEEVQKILFSTKKNEYTKPIPSGEGAVIFKVLQHSPQKTRKLAEIQFDVKQRLAMEKGMQKNPDLNETMAAFHKSAKIDIQIERYKKLLDISQDDEEKADKKKDEAKDTEKKDS